MGVAATANFTYSGSFKEENNIKDLFIGDIVGATGRKALKQVLPSLKQKYSPHIIIANGENSTHGKGINRKVANEYYEMGIHAITLGNHAWDNKEVFDIIDTD